MNTRNRLLATYSFSFLSDGIFISTLPIIAIYLGEPPSMGAILVGIFNLPWLLLSIYSGTVIDRYNPTYILKISNIIRSITSLLIAMMIYNSSYYNYAIFCLLVFIVGACEVFYENTCPTIPPKILQEKDLLEFNGKSETYMRLFRMVLGKFLGPVLTQIVPYLSLIVNCLLFSITSILLKQKIEVQKTDSTKLNLKQILRWISRNPILLKIFTMSVATNAVFSVIISSVPLYLVTILNLDTYTTGISLACMGIGYAIGAAATKHLPMHNIGYIYILAASGISFSIFMIYFSNNLISVSLCLLIYGISMSIRNVINWTYMQQIIPNDIIGRVTATQRTFGWGACAISPIIGAYLIERFGLINQILVFGSISLITLIISINIYRKNTREFVIET